MQRTVLACLLGALGLAGASCQSGGDESTVVVVTLKFPDGVEPPQSGETLQVTSTADFLKPKVQMLDLATTRFGLRLQAGFSGDFTVETDLLVANGCARLSGTAKATLNGERAVEMTVPLGVNDCSDPMPPPTGSLPDVIVGKPPTDIRTWFGGPSGGAAPVILYPFANVMTAPNLHRMKVEWDGDQRYYRVQITGARNSLRAFVACSTSCSLPIDDNSWRAVALGNAGGSVTITISGVSTKGGPVATTAPLLVNFAREDLRGGLYYFSPSIRGIARVPLGAKQPVGFVNNGDETGCAGCHTVSRDGKKVAIEFGSGDTRVGSSVVDGAAPKNRAFALNPAVSWNFAWFDPTGAQLVTNWRGDLAIRSASNGSVVTSMTRDQLRSPKGTAMPEWSPDGKWIAFVRQLEPSQMNFDFALINSGDIVLLPVNNGAVGTPVTLVKGVPNQEVHFFPSWSPDSKWLVFNSVTCGAGNACFSYNAPATRLRLLRAIGDDGNPTAVADDQPGAGTNLPKPIELSAATRLANQTTNWPKFSPFLQGSMGFIVFNAKFAYGHRSAGTPQLFLSAVDLDVAQKVNGGQSGGDPSYAPLWLPFQDETTANHSAIWTTDVACTQAADCPGEFACTGGVCVPTLG